MSRLVWVRHGQASAFAGDYDRLSELGETQARALANYWIKLGQTWDFVIMGPKKRHVRTQEIVGECFRKRGLPWPDPVLLPELDEHRGAAVVKHVLTGGRGMGDSAFPSHLDGDERALKYYLQKFQDITRRWVRRDIQVPHIESWRDFRARIDKGMDLVRAMTKPSSQTVVFTSGGPLAVATGVVLQLDEEKILSLSWQVRNVALAEFLYSGTRLSLISFNALPHLDKPEWLTLV